MRLFSHPGVFLEDHSISVLNIAIRRLNQLVYWQGPAKKLLKMAIALHDFGKSTIFFQQMLRGERKKSQLTRHSKISALFFLYTATKNLSPEQIDEYWLHLLFAYLIILRHHTNPIDIYNELYFDRDLNLLGLQVKSIPEEVNIYLEKLSPFLECNISFDAKDFISWLHKLDGSYFRKKWRKKDIGVKEYFTFLSGLSLLLDSDRISAGQVEFPQKINIPPDCVTKYKESKGYTRTKINSLREMAYQEVLNGPFSPDRHFYTITLPTGMGKTLTGFSAALKLRQMIYQKKGKMPKIIYALPFLSIIEQNAGILEEVLGKDNRLLIKHHHLADMQYHTDEDEFDENKATLLIEGWYAEVVVTTFVQLFNTLFAWQKGSIRRVNQLEGAILLLDEVQALPPKYWPVIRQMFMEVAKHMDTYIILMTATQPYLFKENAEIISNPDLYFLDRMDINVDCFTPQTIKDFVSNFTPEDKSYLFVVNTIRAAKELYRELSKKLKKEQIGFLSSEIIPKERVRLVKELKKYRFVVSTQVIEAGVDLDFDVVYRDFAPLDSLIQASGRCNRNATPGKKGQFHIIRLIDKNKRPFAFEVYDSVLLFWTEKYLQKDKMTEPEFLKLTESYFRDIWQEGIDKGKSDLWEAVERLRFSGPFSEKETYICQFSLISEQYKKNVFIQIDDEAVEIWRRVKESRGRIGRDLEIRFYQYVTSVDEKTAKGVFPWDDDLQMYVLEKSAVSTYYGKTGFVF